MLSQFFKEVFTLTGTRGRKSYIINQLKLFLVFGVLISFPLSLTLPVPGLNLITSILLGVVVTFWTIGSACLAYTRLADLRISRAWAIIVFFPIASLVLWLFLAVTARQEVEPASQQQNTPTV